MEGLAGAALVALVLSDVFRTVVLPRPARRGLRLGPPLRSGALRVWKAVIRRLSPEARAIMLGTLGPLLIVTELVVWVALLILGYGLLLHALGDGVRPVPGFMDALYAAGGSFLTLGMASPQEAVSVPVRLVVLIAAGSGLTVVTLVVTFLLSVQEALQRREALVLRLRARTGPKPSGLAVLDTHARLSEEHQATLREFFADWEAWCADVLLTHRAFPILAYFRSNDEDCGWLAALGAVLDAAALVKTMSHDGSAEHAVLCHIMGTRLVQELAEQFRLQPDGPDDVGRDRFVAVLRRLEQSGYDAGGDDAAWERFQPLRSQYHPALQGLLDRFDVAGEGW